MFERYTDRARRVVVLAQEEARELGAATVDAGHLILGMIHEGDGIAAQILTATGLTLESARTELYPGVRPDTLPTGHLPIAPAMKRAMELALREALQLGHNYIGTEHLLLGLLRDDSMAEFFFAHGIDHRGARQAVITTEPVPNKGHVRKLLVQELVSLDIQVAAAARELDRLKEARADVQAHLDAEAGFINAVVTGGGGGGGGVSQAAT